MARDDEHICFECIWLLFVLILLFFGVTFLFSLGPLTPRFGVNLASINSLKINNSKITAEWDITLFMSNPNRFLHSVSYDNVSIGVNYSYKKNQSLLATTLLNPFSQESFHRDNKRVQFNMDVNNDVATDIADSCSRGAVKFGIELSTTFKYKGMYDHFRRARPLKVVCEPLSFISSQGHLNGSSNWVLVRGLVCH